MILKFLSRRVLCLTTCLMLLFLIPVSCKKNTHYKSPYPASQVIDSIIWEPKDQIRRFGQGSDIWPMTWADNGLIYTAWGDGWGFDRKDGPKLSMGVGFIDGDPQQLSVHDLAAPSVEYEGQGPSGIKPSSMLAIGNQLFLWLRNIDGNGRGCRLAKSDDLGLTWSMADWSFPSLGYCVFLNYGRGYHDARDNYVYVYSPNGDSAYEPADGMVLLRVHRDDLMNRSSYRYYAGMNSDNSNHPLWATKVAQKREVFSFPGECLRLSVSYHPKLNRYLLWQQLPSSSGSPPDTRFEGGFAIYEAPEPWGPWATVFLTPDWDVGPGETASIPAKWIDKNSMKFYLVFSGDDALSIRRGEFIPAGFLK